MRKKHKLWSVTRIRDPRYPHIQLRVTELTPEGNLYAVRMVEGRQRMTVLTPRATRLSLGPHPQDKARALALDLIERLATEPEALPAPSGDGTLTLSQLLVQYEARGFHRTSAAYKRDSCAAIRRILAHLGDQVVTALKPSDVAQYVEHRIRQGKTAAARADWKAVGFACAWAIGEGLLATNPLDTKRAREAMKVAHEPRRPWVTPEQFQRLAAVAPQVSAALPVLIALAWWTGRRIAAIVGLRWTDVYFDEQAAFEQAKALDAAADWRVEDFANGGVRWYAGRGRSKKVRDHVAPLHPAARAALARWREQCSAIGTAYVFVSPRSDAKPLKQFAAMRWLKRAEQLAGLPHQAQSGWHAFRRGWATARKTLPLKDLARAGDWADGGTPFRHYQQADRESTLAVINYGG
jgi:integrase